MIDFRYHLVSLVAVFLALAVGVVLGSGPLRTALVSQLSQEADELRVELADAKANVTTAQLDGVIGQEFVDEAAPTLLAGTVKDQRVAIIRVLQPDEVDVTAIRDRLVQGGATITANLTILPSWTEDGQVAFRAAFAGQVAGTVVGMDAAVAPDRVLAHTLAQALVPTEAPVDEVPAEDGVDPVDQASGAERARVLFDLLKEANLVSGTISGDVTGVVFVVGSLPADADAEALTALSDVFAQVAGTIDDYVGSSVVATGPRGDGGVAIAVESSPLLAARVTTITDSTNYYGAFAVVLALEAEIAGKTGHFGYGEGLSLIPAR